MADLITHGAVALLWKAGPRARHVAAFFAGNVAPDLLSRGPTIALSFIHQHVFRLPHELVFFWTPLHMPAGMLLSAYPLCFLFAEGSRRAIFANVLGGMLVHLAVDLMQYHYGVGYSLIYPLKKRTWELGWIGSEDTVFIAPALARVTAVVWGPRWRRAWRAWGLGPPPSRGSAASRGPRPLSR